MKLLSSEIILTIVKLFDIKHSVILQNIYLLLLKNSVLIIICLLKIFISQCCILKLILIFVRFIVLLAIRMMKFFMHVNTTELLKLFTTFILLLLRSCLVNQIPLLLTRQIQSGQNFQLLSVFLHTKHLTILLTLFLKIRAQSVVHTESLMQYLQSN